MNSGNCLAVVPTSVTSTVHTLWVKLWNLYDYEIKLQNSQWRNALQVQWMGESLQPKDLPHWIHPCSNMGDLLNAQVYALAVCRNTEEEPLGRSRFPILNFIHPNTRYVGTASCFLTSPGARSMSPATVWQKSRHVYTCQVPTVCISSIPVRLGRETPVFSHLQDDSWAARALFLFVALWRVGLCTLPCFGLEDSVADWRRWTPFFRDIVSLVIL